MYTGKILIQTILVVALYHLVNRGPVEHPVDMEYHDDDVKYDDTDSTFT